MDPCRRIRNSTVAKIWALVLFALGIVLIGAAWYAFGSFTGVWDDAQCARKGISNGTAIPTSLLDIVVFGRASAEHVVSTSKPGLPHKPLAANAGEASVANLDKVHLPCARCLLPQPLSLHPP